MKKWKVRSRSRHCYDWAKAAGYSTLQASLLAGRYTNVETLRAAFSANIKDMDVPDSLPDIELAANRIVDAIINKEVICIETDHDADGVTSHAVIHHCLSKLFGVEEGLIQGFIGHRLKEGYGLSDSLAERILASTPPVTLVITADNGSSDEVRIAKLKALGGIDTIVTDHHEIPEEGIPASAFAVVSPARENSSYPDPLIAGCMVACLLMAATRKKLIEASYFEHTPPSVACVFDFVALGTVADCVSMSRSKNNRLVVNHGLKRMNADSTRPCWQALKLFLGQTTLTAQDLGFKVAPRLNARGRLDEAMAGVRFLLADTVEEADELLKVLDSENNERKRIESALKESALVFAEQYVQEGYQSLVIFLEDGHPGVHGIVASRMTEAYGLPSVVLSPKVGDDNVIAASARGVDGFHVRDALQAVDHRHPGLLLRFGGHKGAAGLILNRADIETFRAAFEVAAREQIETNNIETGPVIWSDGVIPERFISLDSIDVFDFLEPIGKEMDAPSFESEFTVIKAKRTGTAKNHLKLTLKAEQQSFDGVMFNINPELSDQELLITENSRQRFMFTLSKNHFRGEVNLQLMIKDIAPIN